MNPNAYVQRLNHEDRCEQLSPIKRGEYVFINLPIFGRPVKMLVEKVDLWFSRGGVDKYTPADYVPENIELSLVVAPKLDGSATFRTRARLGYVSAARKQPRTTAPDPRRFKITRKEWGPMQGYEYPIEVLDKFDDVDHEIGMFLEHAEPGDERAVGNLIIWRIQ